MALRELGQRPDGNSTPFRHHARRVAEDIDDGTDRPTKEYGEPQFHNSEFVK